LSLVRRIVEAHRGQGRENGAYGQGARFEIEFRKAKRSSVEMEG
jgi:signal transduction histidine kinase